LIAQDKYFLKKRKLKMKAKTWTWIYPKIGHHLQLLLVDFLLP
jgi:hypothetical protein